MAQAKFNQIANKQLVTKRAVAAEEANTKIECYLDDNRDIKFNIRPINLKTFCREQADEENSQGLLPAETYTKKRLLADCFELNVTDKDIIAHIYARVPAMPREMVLPKMVTLFEVKIASDSDYQAAFLLMKAINHIDYAVESPLIPIILQVSGISLQEKTTNPTETKDFALMIWLKGLVNRQAPVNYVMQIKTMAPQHRDYHRTVKSTVCDIRGINSHKNAYDMGCAFLLTPAEVRNLTSNGKYPIQIYVQFDKRPTYQKPTLTTAAS